MPDSRLLDFVLDYQARGWSIIPTAAKTKQAAGKWKQYQERPANEPQIRQWFSNGKDYGVAVVLGKVSGNLVCRDFDQQEAYDRWAAAHPDLAKTLPTVATSRGRRHVYFRASDADLRFEDLGDGEYRGDSGHYCVLPPSRHPSGVDYCWQVPLRDGPLPFVEDVRAAGFLDSVPYVTERTETTERTQGTERAEDTESTQDNRGLLKCTEAMNESQHCSVLSVTSTTTQQRDGTAELQADIYLSDIEHAIVGTLPRGPGRRNRLVFELARALKSIPALADAAAIDMEEIVRKWHSRALPCISTQPFEETMIDFIHAWPKVKFPKGREPMVSILKRARELPLPAAADRYEQDGLRLLVSICRELQKDAGDKPFFLGCRTAAWAIGLKNNKGEPDHVKSWRWLDLLVAHEVVKEVEKGDRARRRASRYRYLAD